MDTCQVTHSEHDSSVFCYNVCQNESQLSALPIPRHMDGSDVIELHIPFPSVNMDVVLTQKDIFENTWPYLTQAAQTRFPAFAKLYDSVKRFNLPNFMGAQQQVPSGLNLKAWECELNAYHDREICYFLKFGWPVGYHLPTPPASVSVNHMSALQHDSHVLHYVDTELAHKAIVGPYTTQPFVPWTRLSPLMTRPKKDSIKRRVIVDMSFPEGEAVNDGIKISSIYGRDTTYSLPSVQDLASVIQQAPSTPWLWKADLARAYRQLRVDPIDTPLLGFGFDSQIYLDMCPSFGCRSSSGACQRVSSAVAYIMATRGFRVLAFLDDFAGVEDTYEKASKAYKTFLDLAAALGLELSHEKCQPPATSMQWLGYNINSEEMYISIPAEKLHQVLQECRQWINRSRASRTMIQSIIGKLVHLANCVRHARKFTTRILATLRSMNDGNKSWITLNKDFKADISWFIAYAESANGISLISPVKEYIFIECDSSLEGGGGNSANLYYKWKYSQEHKTRYPSIHMLEAINLIIAYRTLCPTHGTAGKCVVLITDNLGSRYALASGRTKDPVLGACSRELWLEAARADHEIEIQHKEGAKIPLADALSRFYIDPVKATLALNLAAEYNLSEVAPKLSGYVFCRDI